MASRTVETLFKFRQDQQSSQQTINRLDEISAAESRVAFAAEDIRKNAALAGRELAGAVSGRVAGGFDKLGDSAEQAKTEIKQLRNEINQTEDSIDRARAAQERFDDVSRQVALAGDVQSNLGAVGGLAGIAGAGGVSSGIGIAGELAALTEELPRLKQAAAGIPDVLANAGAAIGIPGGAAGFLGAVAGVGIAFVAVNKIMGDAKKRAEEAAAAAAEATRAALDANQRVAAVIAEGSVAGAQAAIESTERNIREFQARLDRVGGLDNLADALDESEYGARVFRELTADTVENLDDIQRANLDEFLGRMGTSVEAIEDFGLSLSDISPDTIREEIDGLNTSLDREQNALSQLNDLLESGTLSAEDAAAAEHLLADARSQLLSAAQQLIQTEVQQAQLLDQSTEALQDRLEAIDAERRGIEEAIQFLRQSGDTSEEVARQIATYEQTLQRLGDTQDFINNQALESARVREEAAQAEEDLDQARKDEADRLQRLANAQGKYNDEIEAITERGLQARADLEQRYADRLVSIAEKAVEDSEKALADLEQTRREAATDLSRDIQDAEIERGRELLDNQIDLQRREVDLARDTARRIEDIRRAQAAREEDLLLQSDFAGLFQSRRQANRDTEGALIDQGRASDDLSETFARQQQDQLRAFDQQRQDRLREYDRELKDAQDKYNREAALIRENESKQLALADSEYQKQTNALQDSLNEQLNARQTTYSQEIQMAAQTSAQLQAIEAQKNAALIAQAQASLSAINRLGSQVFANINNTTNNVNRVGVGGNLVVQSTGGVRDVQRAIVGVLDRIVS